MEFIHEAIKKDDLLNAKVMLIDSNLIKKGTINDPLEGLKHWHRSVELIYIIAGQQYTIINGKKIINQKDDLLIINSCDVHACGNNDEAQNLAICIQIDYKMLRKLYLKDAIFFNDQINSQAYTQIKEVMKKIYDKTKENDQYKNILINGYLFEIYYLLAKLIDNKYQKEIISDQNYINLQEMLDYIDTNYPEDLTLKLLAKQFNYSVSYITKTFKKFSNTTFKEYLTHVRLINSEMLLINTSYSVSDIALMVGFSSLRAFDEAFKKQYQTTPNNYRKIYN